MIKNEVIKIFLEDNNFLCALQLLINKIFRESRYLQKWKTELIRPIHKKEETCLEKTIEALVSHHAWENSLTVCY